ncbi:MAG: methyltransferase domain-containing protein [Desulfarculaceae bacterium]|nr:methyltransferase domain-containing protein [Desulfarculaceae bacterium]MCF8073671.1 methyltransferase domain-containing protein [Desulfarculaceae bacterium]MCF8101912.1 methyltransferase domain-containing protein [Desulfarculaceae bacterium]MCF8117665.1 methyltransferase domain-containing protein [Desulfarculaceae bacterium]
MHATTSRETATPHPRGPSSYAMQDAARLWRLLDLEPGQTVADLGCGPGDYALEAARGVGPRGRVWALDQDRRLLAGVQAKAHDQGLRQLCTVRADLCSPLPLQGGSVDLCLLATVLHVIKFTLAEGSLLGEIRRVLRPGGRLAVLNCSLKDLSFGPPEHLRIPAREMDQLLKPHGFAPTHLEDFGFNYLALYRRA